MKKIIQAAWTRDHLDQQKLTCALLQYRNTPSLWDQLSPAQKLFGQPIQDALPAHCRAFTPQWQTTAEEAEKHAATKAEQVETYYNQHATVLPEIRIGSHVAVQNTVTKQWDIYGVVTAISPHCWYFVKTSSGQVLITNCRYLRMSMYDVLLEKASDSQTKAHLLALACPESGAWLNALLIAALGLCLRLGASLCRPHICLCCGATVSGHMA